MCLAAVAMSGCKTVKPYDYTNFRAHPPRSILVLPPLNESTSVAGTYGYLSTITRPVAERGYYVFPVAVIDQFMRENGLPGAHEMQEAPLAKISEVTGADAVLYLDLKHYDTNYRVLGSVTHVEVIAKLLDTRSALVLWEGKGDMTLNSGSTGNILGDLVAALVTQIINKKTDNAHRVSQLANIKLLEEKKAGLPFGPYSPRYNKDP